MFFKKQKEYKKVRIDLDFSNGDVSKFFDIIEKIKLVAGLNGVDVDLWTLDSKSKRASFILKNNKKNPECFYNLAVVELEGLIELGAFDCAKTTIVKK